MCVCNELFLLKLFDSFKGVNSTIWLHNPCNAPHKLPRSMANGKDKKLPHIAMRVQQVASAETLDWIFSNDAIEKRASPQGLDPVPMQAKLRLLVKIGGVGGWPSRGEGGGQKG